MVVLGALAASLSFVLVAGGQTVSSAEIERIVRAAVSARLQAIGSTARIAEVSGVRDYRSDGAQPQLRIGEIAGPWPRAQLVVPLEVVAGRRVLHAMTARVRLQDERIVQVYEADYPRARSAETLRFRPGLVDMTCCPGSSVEGGKEGLAGLRTLRAVRAGQPVMREDFEPVPEVSAQQHVSVGVQQGAVRLVTKGTALSDGRIGDRIAVRLVPSHTTLRVRVIGPGRVTLDE